jgi:hypothetical protein
VDAPGRLISDGGMGRMTVIFRQRLFDLFYLSYLAYSS